MRARCALAAVVLATARWGATAATPARCVLSPGLALSKGMCVAFHDEPMVTVAGCDGSTDVFNETDLMDAWHLPGRGLWAPGASSQSTQARGEFALLVRQEPQRSCLVRAAGWSPWKRVQAPKGALSGLVAASAWVNQVCGTARFANGSEARAGRLGLALSLELAGRRSELLRHAEEARRRLGSAGEDATVVQSWRELLDESSGLRPPAGLLAAGAAERAGAPAKPGSSASERRCLRAPAAAFGKDHDPGRAFLREVVLRHWPVVLEGSGSGSWRARRSWAPSSLRALAGSRMVHVKATDDGVFEGVEPLSAWRPGPGEPASDVPTAVRDGLASPHVVVARAAGLEMLLATFLDWLGRAAGRPHAGASKADSAGGGGSAPSSAEQGAAGLANASLYIEYTSLREWVPSMAEDAPPLRVESALQHESSNVWIGDGRALGKLHFDPSEGLLSPVAGTKRVVLLPPYANELLGEGHIREGTLSAAGWEGGAAGGGAGAPSLARGALSEATSIVHSVMDLVTPPAACSNATALRADQGLAAVCPSAAANAAAAAALWSSRIECEVGPGESLFIPAHWWHEVQSSPGPTLGGADEPEVSLAVNSWFRAAVNRAFPCPAEECPFALDKGVYGFAL